MVLSKRFAQSLSAHFSKLGSLLGPFYKAAVLLWGPKLPMTPRKSGQDITALVLWPAFGHGIEVEVEDLF